MFTNGSYFDMKNRARVMIGIPIIPSQVADPSLSDKENIEKLNRVMREKIISLGQMLNERTKEKG